VTKVTINQEKTLTGRYISYNLKVVVKVPDWLEEVYVARLVLDIDGLDNLIRVLQANGYRTIGPVVKSIALVYDEINSVTDLPHGYADEQKPGHYRLLKIDDAGYFDYVVGSQSLKTIFHPPRATLLEVKQKNGQLTFVSSTPAPEKIALIGVRPCEVAAMRVQDKVFAGGEFRDPRYMARRENVFIVAVNCTRPGGNCFCVSMQSGPKVDAGFDLSLTEIKDGAVSEFVVEIGSERGREFLEKVPHREATHEKSERADQLIEEAAAQMGKALDTTNIKSLLQDNHDHAHWKNVESRCLACGNCTSVCPTCFCSAVEDVSDLTGHHATRERRWESCFTRDFTYIHGGYVRQSGASRYRHWLTHKLASWHDQFGSSGCVGCGRCITWCPVGINIIDEVQAIREAQKENTRLAEEAMA
jgi:ferredoxin